MGTGQEAYRTPGARTANQKAVQSVCSSGSLGTLGPHRQLVHGQDPPARRNVFFTLETRTVPAILEHTCAVIGPDGQRLGAVSEPLHVAKLLAADRQAYLQMCRRRGAVILQDEDAWFCLFRVFSVATYLPASFVVRRQISTGERFYELLPSRYVRLVRWLMDSRARRNRRESLSQRPWR